jgi:hypothetical protein
MEERVQLFTGAARRQYRRCRGRRDGAVSLLELEHELEPELSGKGRGFKFTFK